MQRTTPTSKAAPRFSGNIFQLSENAWADPAISQLFSSLKSRPFLNSDLLADELIKTTRESIKLTDEKKVSQMTFVYRNYVFSLEKRRAIFSYLISILPPEQTFVFILQELSSLKLADNRPEFIKLLWKSYRDMDHESHEYIREQLLLQKKSWRYWVIRTSTNEIAWLNNLTPQDIDSILAQEASGVRSKVFSLGQRLLLLLTGKR
jgi:hypothetical protein